MPPARPWTARGLGRRPRAVARERQDHAGQRDRARASGPRRRRRRTRRAVRAASAAVRWAGRQVARARWLDGAASARGGRARRPGRRIGGRRRRRPRARGAARSAARRPAARPARGGRGAAPGPATAAPGSAGGRRLGGGTRPGCGASGRLAARIGSDAAAGGGSAADADDNGRGRSRPRRRGSPIAGGALEIARQRLSKSIAGDVLDRPHVGRSAGRPGSKPRLRRDSAIGGSLVRDRRLGGGDVARARSAAAGAAGSGCGRHPSKPSERGCDAASSSQRLRTTGCATDVEPIRRPALRRRSALAARPRRRAAGARRASRPARLRPAVTATTATSAVSGSAAASRRRARRASVAQFGGAAATARRRPHAAVPADLNPDVVAAAGGDDREAVGASGWARRRARAPPRPSRASRAAHRP